MLFLEETFRQSNPRIGDMAPQEPAGKFEASKMLQPEDVTKQSSPVATTSMVGLALG
jgi:hypothetical protein